jgi:glutamate dehydrogenase
MSTAEEPAETAGNEKALDPFIREQLESIVDPQELRRQGTGFLDEIARGAATLVERLLPGEIHVRVSNPGGDRRGRTVVEVLVADQVFLVDSFRLSLNRFELRILRLLHPLLPIERDDDGSVARLGKRAVPRLRESYIYAELPLVESQARRDEIECELRRVLASAQSVVTDHVQMLEELHKHAELLDSAAAKLGLDPDQGLMGFLRWLTDDNYVFVGYRHYEVCRRDGSWEVKTDPSSGLGVLRDRADSRFVKGARGADIPPLVRARLDDTRLVYFDKSRAEATIHRHGRLDSISIKMFDDSGELIGFGRFVGMLTHQAIRTRPSAIPLLAQKRELVIDAIGAEEGSYTYKAVIAAFDSLPVEFLFPRDVPDIEAAVVRILKASENHQVEVCVVLNARDRSFFLSVVLPRGLYNERLRHDIHELLLERYHASYVDDRSSFVDDDIALMHFFCSCPEAIDLKALEALESDIHEQAEPWGNRLERALLTSCPAERAGRLHDEYASAFPEEYRLVMPPGEAALDVEQLEQLRWGKARVGLRLSVREEGGEKTYRLKVYQIDRPYLTDLLPVLDRFGFRVIDAALTEVANGQGDSSWIVAFRIEELCGFGPAGQELEERVLDGLSAALSGYIEGDSLNRLILSAGLDWRSVDLLRAYLAYSRQSRGVTLPRARARPHPDGGGRSGLLDPHESDQEHLAHELLYRTEARCAAPRRLQDRLDAGGRHALAQAVGGDLRALGGDGRHPSARWPRRSRRRALERSRARLAHRDPGADEDPDGKEWPDRPRGVEGRVRSQAAHRGPDSAAVRGQAPVRSVHLGTPRGHRQHRRCGGGPSRARGSPRRE